MTPGFGIDAARLVALVAAELSGASGGDAAAREGTFAGLREWRHRLDTLLHVVTEGVVVLDFTGAVVYVSGPARALLGIGDPGAFLGRGLADLYAGCAVRGVDGAPIPSGELPGRAALRGKHREELVRLAVPGGEDRWVSVRAAPISDAQGRSAVVVLILRDTTTARRGEQRLRLLADAGEQLAAGLRPDATASAFASLLVPRLASAAVVFLRPLDGPGGATSVHAAATKGADALSSGLAAWWDDLGEGLVAEQAEALRLGPDAPGWPVAAATAGLSFGLLLPLSARGRALGALLLLTHPAPLDPLDEETAAELARRCALAIDNARLYRLAEEANLELAEADRRKDRFLAVLGHELRNPLAPVLSAVEMLEGAGPAERGAILEPLLPVLGRQARHLARIVDDLLDVSRLDHDKLRLRVEPLDMAELLSRALASSRWALLGRELRSDFPAEALTVSADPVRLAQVFGNLLHNAAKYTDPGARIEVRARREAGQVVVTVEDTGAGIAAETLPHIFDLLGRDHGGRRQGLGVGLHLARSLVHLHGGALSAHSDGPGRGSRFTVTLPLATETAPRASPEPLVLTAAAPRFRDVLLVEDDPDVAAVLVAALKRFGCHPRRAGDGPAALASAAAEAPELVLLDLGLPGMNGHDVARRLRAAGCAAPIVALSGYAGPGDGVRSAEAGVDLHLAKPLALRTLQALVTGELGLRRSGPPAP